MKKTVKMIPILLISIILLLGCGNSSKRNDAFVGKWRANASYADITFDFKKNGTVEFYNSGETMSAKWETGEIDKEIQGRVIHFFTLEIKNEEESAVLLYLKDLEKSDTELDLLNYDGEDLYIEYTIVRE